MRFAAIGIDHGHIFHHIDGLIAAGAVFAGYCPETTVPSLLEQLRKAHPRVPERGADALFNDPAIDVICTAAVPSDRAGIAVRAMRSGKDVMADKPGLTTFAQLEEVRRAVAETRRIYSVCFSERLCVRSAVRAAKIVQSGRIGRVVQTLGVGPHRKGSGRPDWFWDPLRYGGILVDIASHQIDQFLHYTASAQADVVASQVANFDTPHAPAFEDFGDVMLRSGAASGYIRVDWFTPGGLGTWGDGRLTILGTQGTIELRKYIDIQGRPGTDHLFIADREKSEYIHCGDQPIEYFEQFAADVRDRTETAMTQAHVFEVCRLSLVAQTQAVRIGGLQSQQGPVR